VVLRNFVEKCHNVLSYHGGTIMAKSPIQRPTARNHFTIRLPIRQEEYQEMIAQPNLFRQWLNSQFALHPELFPENFADGYALHSTYQSKKLNILTRRIWLPNRTIVSIRPAFVMPSMTAFTDDARDILFLM
jgi:hypothetical protein